MEEKINNKVYFDRDDFQHLIWEFISSGEYKKILEHMRDGDNTLFHDGFIQGLCWASMMSVNARAFDMKELENFIEGYKEMIEITSTKDKTNVFEEEKHPLEDILNQPYKGEPLKVTL